MAKLDIAEQVLKPEYFRPQVADSSSIAPTAAKVPSPGINHAFDEAMMQIYLRAKKEAGYNATRFHQMLADHGGVETARSSCPRGLTGLRNCGSGTSWI